MKTALVLLVTLAVLVVCLEAYPAETAVDGAALAAVEDGLAFVDAVLNDESGGDEGAGQAEDGEKPPKDKGPKGGKGKGKGRGRGKGRKGGCGGKPKDEVPADAE